MLYSYFKVEAFVISFTFIPMILLLFIKLVINFLLLAVNKYLLLNLSLLYVGLYCHRDITITECRILLAYITLWCGIGTVPDPFFSLSCKQTEKSPSHGRVLTALPIFFVCTLQVLISWMGVPSKVKCVMQGY